MANYIDREIICESYVHLDIPHNTSKADIDKIKNQLKKFFDDRVKFLLGNEVETSIQTEEGSLKVTLTAVAAVAGLLGTGILKYPDFRNAVRVIHEDSKMLAEATNLETIFITRTPACYRLHAEVRTGVIGRTAKLLTAIDTLKANIDGTKAPSTRTEVFAIDQLGKAVTRMQIEAIKIVDKVSSDEDKFCLAKGFHDALKQLPEVLPAEQLLKQDAMKQALLKQGKQDLLIIAAFQNYTASVKSSKDALKRIGVAAKPRSPSA